MNKHAYLIVANSNKNQLQLLINSIDDSRNDIYLLIDKKSYLNGEYFYSKYSNIYNVDPINIYWGSYSQIQAEIDLFKSSTLNYHYAYYHLLSGKDLPLDNQDNIHKFFDNNQGKNFIGYSKMQSPNDLNRRLKYRLFRHHYRDDKMPYLLINKIQEKIVNFEIQNKIPKNKIGFASNWVSITDRLARFILKNEKFIKDKFYTGRLMDEIFIPTLLNIFPSYKKDIYYSTPMNDMPNDFQGNLRYINWWDGSPYVWKEKDFDILVDARNKGHLFSRKFDEKIDDNIIQMVYSKLILNKKDM